MGSNKNMYYLITEAEIYRSDEILKQIDGWIHAFRTGRLVQAQNATPEEIDEFEAHLESICLETQSMIQHDLEF